MREDAGSPQIPIHGTRLEKDAPAEAVQDALRLLYTVNLIAKTAGVPVFALKRAVSGWEVSASVHGPLAFKQVKVAPPAPERTEENEEVRLVWMPEGFVITPRTAGAPDGFGMPPTPDGKGTPGGPLRQVIINRFKHNQYPDALYRAQGAGDARVNCANLFFMDWEMVQDPADKPKKDQQEGFRIGMDGVPQFDPKGASRWTQKFKEPDGGRWFCHRPMHAVGYEDEVRKRIREETNLVREAAGGRRPVAPPLRGSEGALSANILYQMSYAHLQEHDSEKYRLGHRTFVKRINDRTGLHTSAGENLYSSRTDLSEEFAQEAADWWAGSAEHYGNMVYRWEIAEWVYDGNNALHPTLDTGTRAELDLTAMAPSIRDATSASQIFIGHRAWTDPGLVSGKGSVKSAIAPHATAQGHGYFPLEITNFLTPGTLRGEPDFGPEKSVYFEGDPTGPVDPREKQPLFFSVHGRAALVRFDADPYMMLLAGTVAKSGAKQVIRLCVAESPDPFLRSPAKRQVDIVIYEGRAEDYLGTRAELSRFRLPALVCDIAAPKFSASGDKLVFSYAQVGVADSAFRDHREGSGAVLSPPAPEDWNTAPQFVWGDALHFLQWRVGAGFSEVATASLNVGVTFVGAPPFEGALDNLEQSQARCFGSCRYLADYDEAENIVYATLEVSATSEFRSGTSSTTTGCPHEASLWGKLVFPGGKSLVFQDIRTKSARQGPVGTWAADLEAGAQGFFLQICYLNILQPELITYVQQNLGETLQPATDSSFSGMVRQAHCATSLWVGSKLVAEYGDSLRQPASPVQEHAHIGPTPFGPYSMTREQEDIPAQPTFLPFIGATSVGPGGDATVGGGASMRFPVRSFKAALVSPAVHSYVDDFTLQASDPTRWVSGLGYIGMDAMYFVGPLVLNPVAGSRIQRTEVCTYGNDFIVAGEIRRTIGKPANHAVGMEKFFYHSSLDLKAITGFSDLQKNILPIGAIR